MHKNELLAFIMQHKWQILGALGGLLFCILVFVINFWRTLFLFADVPESACRKAPARYARCASR